MEQIRARNRLSSPPIESSPLASYSGLSGDPERSRKIARIRRAVKSGRYHIESSDVAAKLIEHMFRPQPGQ